MAFAIQLVPNSTFVDLSSEWTVAFSLVMLLAIWFHGAAKVSCDLNFDIPKGSTSGEGASVTKKGNSAEIILRPGQSGSNNTDLDSLVVLGWWRPPLWLL